MKPEHDKLLAEIRCNTSNYVFKVIIKTTFFSSKGTHCFRYSMIYN